MINNDLIRKRIKQRRASLGISCPEMANRLHMDERNYKWLESGERKTLDIQLIIQIAEILNMDYLELLKPDTIFFQHNSGVIGLHNSDFKVEMSAQSIAMHYENIIKQKDLIITQLLKNQSIQ